MEKPRLCRDCVHSSRWELRCTRDVYPGPINLVDGKRDTLGNRFPCTERTVKGDCGLEGKFYKRIWWHLWAPR